MHSEKIPGYKYKRILMLTVSLVLGAVLFLLAGCSRQTHQTVHLQGKVEAVTTTLPAPVAGKVQGLIVEKGDRIRKGEPLFGIADGTGKSVPGKAAQELAKAQAELRRAQAGAPSSGPEGTGDAPLPAGGSGSATTRDTALAQAGAPLRPWEARKTA